MWSWTSWCRWCKGLAGGSCNSALLFRGPWLPSWCFPSKCHPEANEQHSHSGSPSDCDNVATRVAWTLWQKHFFLWSSLCEMLGVSSVCTALMNRTFMWIGDVFVERKHYSRVNCFTNDLLLTLQSLKCPHRAFPSWFVPKWPLRLCLSRLDIFADLCRLQLLRFIFCIYN